MKVRRVFVVASALAALGTAALPAAAGWARQDVELASPLDQSSLAYIATRPAVAFVSSGVYFSERLGPGSWSRETVDTDPCVVGVSLAVSSAGEPVIAYTGSAGLMVARLQPSGWVPELVDPAGTSLKPDPRGLVVIAYDRNDNPAVAYVGSSDVRFAAFSPSTGWQIEVVETVPAADSAIDYLDFTFDDTGEPAIGYVRNKQLPNFEQSDAVMLARRSGTGWLISLEAFEVLLFLAFPGVALEFDPSGCPVIISGYFTDTAAGPQELGCRDTSFDGWGPGGNLHPSIARDSAGSIGVAYSRSAPGELAFARRGAPWKVETVAAQGERPSLAYDPVTAQPAISFSIPSSYPSPSPQELRFASFDGAAWRFEVIASGRGNLGGASMAYDAQITRGPVVSYATETGLVRFARANGPGFDLSTVAAPVGIVGSVSLALDTSGTPGIAYATQDAVYYAQWVAAQTRWDITQVALSPGGWAYVSLAIDSAGEPAIAVRYQAVPDAPLNLARHVSGSWQIEQVEAQVGRWPPSLAFDRADNPAIAYHTTSNDLRLARWSGSWDLQTVDTIIEGFSLRFDPTGEPAIGYGDPDTSTLRLARWNGSSWDIENVAATTGRVYPSLAFAPDGKPALAYAEDGAGPTSLHFARRDSLGWHTELAVAEVSSGGDLAFDDKGGAIIGYASFGCGWSSSVLLAKNFGAATLRRGVVADLSLGWKAAALPLSASNDDRTAPWPVTTTIPGMLADATPPASAPLVLYRVFWADGTPATATLRLVKDGTGVVIRP